MKNFIQPAVQQALDVLIKRQATLTSYFFPVLFAFVSFFQPPSTKAAPTLAERTANSDASSLTLVFSDDFSVNPNTNGKWTIHRYYGDTDNEASWDSKRHAWDLASAIQGRAAAVFANYELTATTWRAEFRYRAGNFQGMPGGDGFVFMFYKDKAAYGAPDIGNAKAFELFHGRL